MDVYTGGGTGTKTSQKITIFLGAYDNPEELAVSKGTSEKAMVATGVVRNPQKDSFLGLLSEIIWLILNWIKR